MPDLSERRIDAWTALAAEPAVRAAERAILNRSATVLADTLAIAAAAESRRRLAHLLDLKDQAESDPRRRDAYERADDDLRSWAARVYLATLREPDLRTHSRAEEPPPLPETASTKPRNPYTEESISLRRSVPRAPFPGQRGRRPYQAEPPSAGTRVGPRSAPDGAHTR